MTQAANLAALGSSANSTGILPIAGGGTAGTNGAIGFKNRIINGGMTIDQRNAGATSTALAYTVDRWQYDATQTTKFTWGQNYGGASLPSGFINYLGFKTTTAYSVVSSDTFYVRQLIEGLNMADLGWGTASAKSVTLSFWVQSSLTGTFGGSLQNFGGNRAYPFSFTISSANTWEQKTITIVGDTTGTWLTTNGTGMRVVFSLGAGSNYTGTANAWVASNLNGVTGQQQVVGTLNATFYLTGVQFEVGTAATNFDFRSYGTELQLCQRYFQTSYASGTAIGSIVSIAIAVGKVSASGTWGEWAYTPSYVTMRSAPTTTVYNPVTGTAGTYRNYAAGTNVTITSNGGQTQSTVLGSVEPVPSSGQLAFLMFAASAEL